MFTRRLLKEFKESMMSDGMTENEALQHLDDEIFIKQPEYPKQKLKGENEIRKPLKSLNQEKKIVRGKKVANYTKIEEQPLKYFKESLKPTEDDSQSILPDHVLNKDFIFPSIIKGENNTFIGCQGHSSITTSWPIIEGTYYFQCTVENTQFEINPFIKRQVPSFRIGITRKSQHHFTPLGGMDSYGFKSIDGSCIHENRLLSAPSSKLRCKPKDKIGVLLYMSCPYRKSLKNLIKINEGSYLILYLNGKPISIIENLKQNYYVFGFSLFNSASLTVNVGPDFQFPPQCQFEPYINAKDQQIRYEDIDLY